MLPAYRLRNSARSLDYFEKAQKEAAVRKEPTIISGIFGAVFFTLILLVSLDCTCTFAQSEKEEIEDVQFGAENKPGIEGDFGNRIADVAEAVIPSVVSVVPTKVDTVLFHNNPFYRFFGDEFEGEGGSPFDFFFGQPPQGRGPGGGQGSQEPRMQERRRKGLGSGVIVSGSGHILTNYHVVSGADEIEVTLSDERTFQAEILGSDSLSDVAVIKIKQEVENLPVAYLGNSTDIRVGEWVVAVGNPFSLTSTVTAGIVSALGRSVQATGAYEDYIQTDAAINPGNSGGALVNIDGELIGINTMIYTRTGGSMGIGFAIPINMARRIMNDLITKGEVVRGWIGVTIQNIDEATRDVMDLPPGQGVLIGNVTEGDPADRAGIEAGDVILSLNGKTMSNVNELRNTVAAIDPGMEIPVVVYRNGDRKELSIKIGRREPEEVAAAGGRQRERGTDREEEPEETGKLGISVSNISPQLRQQYAIPRGAEGVVITRLDPTLPEIGESLREGDVILSVKRKGSDFRNIRSVKEYRQSVKNIEEGESVMVRILRNGNTFFVAFRVR